MTRGISHLANPVMTCWHVEERDVISGGPGIDKTRFIDPNFVEKDRELHTINYEFIRASTNLKNIQYCSTYN